MLGTCAHGGLDPVDELKENFGKIVLHRLNLSLYFIS